MKILYLQKHLMSQNQFQRKSQEKILLMIFMKALEVIQNSELRFNVAFFTQIVS